MIIKGSNNINNFKFGNSQVDKIFKGEVQVFPDIIENGTLIQTNLTTGSVSCVGYDKDGRIYFGMRKQKYDGIEPEGIYTVNDDGNVISTNITKGQFIYFFNNIAGDLFVICGDSDSYGVSKTYKLNSITKTFEYHSSTLNNNVRSCVITSNNNLYLGGIYVYKYNIDSDSFELITDYEMNGNLVISNNTNKIYFIGVKGINSSTTIRGIFELNETTEMFSTVLDTEIEGYTPRLIFQSNDTIYIKCVYDTVAIFNENNKTIDSINISNVRDIYCGAIDADGTPYLAYDKGVYKLDKGTGKYVITNLSDEVIRTMQLATDGKLYLGGIYVYKVESNQIVKMKYYNDSYIVTPMAMGNNKDGTLYIGSIRYGVFKVVF